MSYSCGDTVCPMCGNPDAYYELNCRSMEEWISCKKCGYTFQTTLKSRFRKDGSRKIHLDENGYIKMKVEESGGYGSYMFQHPRQKFARFGGFDDKLNNRLQQLQHMMDLRQYKHYKVDISNFEYRDIKKEKIPFDKLNRIIRIKRIKEAQDG